MRTKHIFSVFAVAIIMVAAIFGGNLKTDNFLSPLAKNEAAHPAIDDLLPLLEKKQNNFTLNKNPSFVEQVYGANEFDEAKAYGAVDFDTGDVILEKNLESKLPIASITKIMTAVVALDLAHKDELFAISQKASSAIPTKIGVIPGEKMKLSELLNAILLTSANDAAEVIREGIDDKYHVKIFIDAMNMKANIIGLKNTSFQNPQGFDSKTNYSTVEDLAILTHYALSNYPEITEIVKKDYEFLASDSNHKQFDLYNWNGLIGVYPNTYGVKIGSTGRAKKTTAVVSERNGKKIIAIVLGAPGVLERDLWASQILDVAFEKAAGLASVNVSEQDLRDKYTSWKYWN